MNTEKMREEFEAWYCRYSQFWPEQIRESCRYPLLKVWQASRESLVIELPDHYGYDDPGEAIHAINDCRKAIEAAGVKVKS